MQSTVGKQPVILRAVYAEACSI
uniref:Uncharacterized protein n=1 Tax=Anguilla anguilla TaxID=7936 RepID=A0A0E9RQW3_ANGAN